MMASRRQLLALGAGAALGATLLVTMRAVLAAAPAVFAAPALPPVEVWKSPTCGCCAKWALHLEANSFKVQVRDQGNTAARKRAGIAQALGSCHTALVGGYAIEGHVPAADILRLLRERPAAIGLAVPGMPLGSPGMEQGSQRDRYDVLLVARNGKTSVFSTHQ